MTTYLITSETISQDPVILTPDEVRDWEEQYSTQTIREITEERRGGRMVLLADGVEVGHEHPRVEVELVNPVSGATVVRDISDMSHLQAAAYRELIDPDLRSELDLRDWDAPADYISAFVARVGAEEAGRVILGS